jgi:hypothetical protein
LSYVFHYPLLQIVPINQGRGTWLLAGKRL